MEAQGGANNAFTSDDVTVYQDWIPRSALDLVFDLESDRLANLSFDPQVIESERGVVYSERRLRTEDSNEGFLFEQMQATAFVGASLPDPDHRLAGRHPELEARRPAEVLQDQLRPQQLHAGAGGRRERR